MKILLIIPALICFTTFGQIDFNNYATLLSKGAIPEDFTTSTFDKLKNDLAAGNKELTPVEEKIFFEGINYAIDDILHSGYVTYGDDISVYLNKIADKLLKKDTELREKLRFYTLKSNSSNAFSTEQGIVFVTTGLISQITSEAQIAFILAHEIAHYQEHHVVESFSYATKNRRSSIEQMSVYSKDKELTADEKGLEMYRDAGYSKDEIVRTFDVLMYSYLPFDEIEINLSYFQTSDSTYLPTNLFPSEKYEIKAVEDEDDSKSSHPNIKTRKEAIIDQIAKSKNWQTDVNSLGDEKFIEIRAIARFESVRNDIVAAKYGKSLYSIYLLEKEYPKSIFLQRMKAQSWLGLLMYRLHNKISSTIDKKSSYEGESAPVHYMIRNMSKDELEVMAVRQLFDIYTANSTDEEIKLIWERSIKSIVYGDNFELSNFSSHNYIKALDLFNAKQIADSSVVDVVPEIKPKSKYDRIKNKKDVNVVDNFDSTVFHLYLLPDVLSSIEFTEPYEAYTAERKIERENEDAYNAMTYNEKRKYEKQKEKDKLKLGIDELIVVEPTVLSYRRSGLDRVRSEKLEKSFSEVIDETSDATGIKVYPINSSKLLKNGTQSYNERSTLLNMLVQIGNSSKIEPFPVDYQLLNELEANYGTSKVMFSVVENSYDANFGMEVLYAVVFYPIALIYFPLKLMLGNSTEINMIILDTKEAKVIVGASHYIRVKARKHTIGAHMYSIFNQLNSTK